MMSVDGRFVDANILVYAAVEDDVRHARCRKLLTDKTAGTLFLSSQILTEFISVITSAKRVTKPFTPEEAVGFIEALLDYANVVLLPISSDVPSRWLALIKRSPVRGARVFDFQIAATMLVHGVVRLVTFNGDDFKSIHEIEIVEP